MNAKSRKKRMSRRDFFKRSAATTAGLAAAGALRPFSAAADPPVSPVALRKCKDYDRTEIYNIMGRMFTDLGDAGNSLADLVNGKKVTIKLNCTYGRGSSWHHHGRHSMYTDTVHPDVVYAAVKHFLDSGATKVNICECSYTTIGASALFPAMGFTMNDFTDLAAAGVVEFFDTRNKEPYSGADFDGYAQLDPLTTGVGTGSSYMFDSFYVNKVYAAPEADVVVSLAKFKGHELTGVTLGIKNMFGCLPNSIYGGSTPITLASGPNEAGTGGRGDSCHLGNWNPVGEKAGHSVVQFDSERLPHLIADLCRALPINLTIIDGITASQPMWGPSNITSITNPGLLVAGFNPVCTDSVCVGVMGQDPQASRKTGMFLSGENYLNLCAAKGVGSNDLSQIPVLGNSIQEVRYDYYPHLNRSENNPY
ncbi:MAG: DUF362 domain-containing protein [bacterium]